MEGLYPYLAGRQLTKSEIIKYGEGLVDQGSLSLENYLEPLVQQGLVTVEPALKQSSRGETTCQRCGSNDLVTYYCCGCQRECLRCEECMGLGVLTSCKELYSFRPHNYDPLPIKARLAFSLTPAQRQAASQLLGFMVEPRRGQALIWAACGAGKTEVLLPAISYIISQGGRVLYALPRRDVVEELQVRIADAFKPLEVTPLHGGCERQLTDSRIVIATTHQVMRFSQAFDLVILDEEDAYPYKGSEILQRALSKALKPGGKRIFATATPTTQLLASTQKGNNTLITIPARHHGEPVPVPELVIISPWQRGGMPPRALDLIEEIALVQKKPLLIFVPSKSLAQEVAELIKREVALKAMAIGWSTSLDKDRSLKKEALLRGQLNILVTTSIFERGITIPDVQVIVWYAHWEKVFDEGTLIQMAGRVGRTTQFPRGKVYFLGERLTFPMKEATRLIEEQNRLAYKEGFLREE